MSGHMVSDGQDLFSIVLWGFPKVYRLSPRGIVERKWQLSLTNMALLANGALTEVGGIATVDSQLAIADSILGDVLTYDLRSEEDVLVEKAIVELSDLLHPPLALAPMRESGLAVCSNDGQVVLFCDGQGRALQRLTGLGRCGNISDLAWTREALIAVSRSSGCCFRLPLSPMGKWEAVPLEGLSEPTLATCSAEGVLLLGRLKDGSWAMTGNWGTVALEGIAPGEEPVGFSEIGGGYAVLKETDDLKSTVVIFHRAGAKAVLDEQTLLQ